MPQTVTHDGAAASQRAVRELKNKGHLHEGTRIRRCNDSDDSIEQDRRNIEQRIVAMLGFKRFNDADISIAGIGPMGRMRKGWLALRYPAAHGRAAPAVGNAGPEA